MLGRRHAATTRIRLSAHTRQAPGMAGHGTLYLHASLPARIAAPALSLNARLSALAGQSQLSRLAPAFYTTPCLPTTSPLPTATCCLPLTAAIAHARSSQAEAV